MVKTKTTAERLLHSSVTGFLMLIVISTTKRMTSLCVLLKIWSLEFSCYNSTMNLVPTSQCDSASKIKILSLLHSIKCHSTPSLSEALWWIWELHQTASMDVGENSGGREGLLHQYSMLYSVLSAGLTCARKIGNKLVQ